MSALRARAALALPAALASFLLVGAALRSFAPLPEDSGLRRRLDHLADRTDDYQLLFFGPSTVRCNVAPEVFDAELARRGHAVRSLNLGVPGAFFWEIDYLIEQALRSAPRNLRYVVVEFHYMDPAHILARGNAFTERMVYWHDAPRLLGLLRGLWLSPRRRPADAWVGVQHARHFLWRTSAFGRGPAALAALRAAPPGAPAGRGFAPGDCQEPAEQQASRQRFLAGLPAYREALRSIDRLNAAGVKSVAAFDPAQIARQVARIRAAGAEPIYLTSPIPQATPDVRALARAGVLPRLWSFNSPREFPELFEVGSRFDAGHLDAEAAERFSRLLASRFARWLEGGDG